MYVVKAVSLCGTPYTVGKTRRSQVAYEMANNHWRITHRRATIWFNGKRLAFQPEKERGKERTTQTNCEE